MGWAVTMARPAGSRKGSARNAVTAPAVPMDTDTNPGRTMPAPTAPALWSPAPTATGVPADRPQRLAAATEIFPTGVPDFSGMGRTRFGMSNSASSSSSQAPAVLSKKPKKPASLWSTKYSSTPRARTK